MEDLPEDLQIVLTDTMYDLSKVSIIILSFVNKFCYQMSNRCQIRYGMRRNFIKSLVCHVIASNSSLCSAIASEGSLELLKWAISNGYQKNWTIGACAASNGHLEILEWIHSKRDLECINICFWAARRGQLDVLIWAKTNDYKWDSETSMTAILNKHLLVYEWLQINGCPVSYDAQQRAKTLWLGDYSKN